MAAAILGRDLTPTEDALGWVIEVVTLEANTDAVPTLWDVVEVLKNPTESMVTNAQMNDPDGDMQIRDSWQGMSCDGSQSWVHSKVGPAAPLPFS